MSTQNSLLSTLLDRVIKLHDRRGRRSEALDRISIKDPITKYVTEQGIKFQMRELDAEAEGVIFSIKALTGWDDHSMVINLHNRRLEVRG